VAGIAGIYPVFDLRTYPGLETAAPAYERTPSQLGQQLPEFNPIEQAEPLARARVPACLIHGDSDEVVPLGPNSAEFARRYRTAGAGDLVQLIVAAGQGHNFWEGFFRCQPLIDFAIARAKAGAQH
jgi:alpha-beta hydrolase superfamily lysophospholipase